jgi:hypothetical protein
MSKSPGRVNFKAKLLRPATPEEADWSFLLLPAAASAKLPTRSMVSVDGTLAGAPFQATLAPDGQGSHWLKVDAALRRAAGAEVGDTVVVSVAPVREAPEPQVPADLRQALEDNAAARATWDEITAIARRDWIHWIVSGKRAQTRIKRIAVACEKLAKGQRRACCFDRSGMYSNSLSAPKAAAG